MTASSMSLILIHQLEDKQKAHDLFLSFLKNVDLWTRVCYHCGSAIDKIMIYDGLMLLFITHTVYITDVNFLEILYCWKFPKITVLHFNLPSTVFLRNILLLKFLH